MQNNEIPTTYLTWNNAPLTALLTIRSVNYGSLNWPLDFIHVCDR